MDPPASAGREMIGRLASMAARYRPETVVLALFFTVLAVLRAIYGDALTADKLTAKVPAVGPIHFLSGQYDSPAQLSGRLFHSGAEALMNAWRPIHRDCFPSLHTAVSTLTSLWAWRTRRLHRLGPVVATIYLPLNAALWFSTVYLRYHWVVDLVAGWLLSAAVAWATISLTVPTASASAISSLPEPVTTALEKAASPSSSTSSCNSLRAVGRGRPLVRA
jgi:membrane-associated phospholipid phosphatase